MPSFRANDLNPESWNVGKKAFSGIRSMPRAHLSVLIVIYYTATFIVRLHKAVTAYDAELH